MAYVCPTGLPPFGNAPGFLHWFEIPGGSSVDSIYCNQNGIAGWRAAFSGTKNGYATLKMNIKSKYLAIVRSALDNEYQANSIGIWFRVNGRYYYHFYGSQENPPFASMQESEGNYAGSIFEEIDSGQSVGEPDINNEPYLIFEVPNYTGEVQEVDLMISMQAKPFSSAYQFPFSVGVCSDIEGNDFSMVKEFTIYVPSNNSGEMNIQMENGRYSNGFPIGYPTGDYRQQGWWLGARPIGVAGVQNVYDVTIGTAVDIIEDNMYYMLGNQLEAYYYFSQSFFGGGTIRVLAKNSKETRQLASFFMPCVFRRINTARASVVMPVDISGKYISTQIITETDNEIIPLSICFAYTDDNSSVRSSVQNSSSSGVEITTTDFKMVMEPYGFNSMGTTNSQIEINLEDALAPVFKSAKSFEYDFDVDWGITNGESFTLANFNYASYGTEYVEIILENGTVSAVESLTGKSTVLLTRTSEKSEQKIWRFIYDLENLKFIIKIDEEIKFQLDLIDIDMENDPLINPYLNVFGYSNSIARTSTSISSFGIGHSPK